MGITAPVIGTGTGLNFCSSSPSDTSGHLEKQLDSKLTAHSAMVLAHFAYFCSINSFVGNRRSQYVLNLFLEGSTSTVFLPFLLSL